MQKTDAVAALAALAQDSRLDIYRLLVQAGPAGLAAGRIGEALALAPATLSFHLKTLRAAGLIAQRRDGRSLIYAADYARMQGLIGYLTEHCCEDDPQVCGLPAEATAEADWSYFDKNGNIRCTAPVHPESAPMSDQPAAFALPDRIYTVLFLCTGNSARSILAESLMNHLGGGRFRGYSAGSRPVGRVNPHALALLEHLGLPTAGLRSKSWDEFAAPGAPALDFVFTVCDDAAGEVCPVWPGQPMTAHWGVPDPAAVHGSEIEQMNAFRAAFRVLENRIKVFAALRPEALDRLSLQCRLDDIGRSDR